MPENPQPAPPREKFYLTTPIYYVNARPHIGHAYSTIVADVLARRHRLLGHDTFFLTGTDEHGQKIERSAAAAGIPPQQFADQVSQTFQTLWQRMGITHDAFIRTTSPPHKHRVQKLFTTLYEQGHIYLSTYTGQYSIGEEMFVDGPPGTLGPDGRPTETVTEENFFFRLSAFQQPLLDLIESNTLKITPESARNEVLSFLRGGLKDLSVSRSSFTWGIPVPVAIQRQAGATQNHIVYVWLDALANYITAIGFGSETATDKELFEKYWPADLHLIGKEISRFHCVYWPAFLLALNPAIRYAPAAQALALLSVIPEGNLHVGDLEQHRAWAAQWLPRQVTANGWLLFDNSKMSKSRGNVVRTETILDAFGEHVYKKQFPDSTKQEQDLFAADVLRFFLLREIPFGQDGSFSFEAIVTRYNADLANGYGNLVSRTLVLTVQNFSEGLPKPSPPWLCPDRNVFREGNEPKEKFEDRSGTHFIISQIKAFVRFSDEMYWPENKFHLLLAQFGLMVSHVDAYLSFHKPWLLAKVDDDLSRRRLVEVLYTAAEAIRILTAILFPSAPTSTARVWSQLGLGDIEQSAKNGDLNNLQWGGLQPGTRLGPLSPIFPRADKSLPQLMEDLERAANESPKAPAMPPAQPTRDTSQQPAAPKTHPAQPLKDHGDPSVTAAPAGAWTLNPEPSSAGHKPTGNPANAAPSGPWALSPEPSPPRRFAPNTAPHVPEDPTHPGAPPRTTSALTNPDLQSAGTSVAGSHAITTEREGTPPHAQAPASGIFAATAGPSRPEASPHSPEITIDDFVKIDLRAARIVVAERIPKADKLLRLEVDLGTEQRQILSGIAEWYTPEDLLGRTVVVIANLAPRKMRGLISHGMLLAAAEGEDTKPILATFAEGLAPGTRLR